MNLDIKMLSTEATRPSYATERSSAMDVYADLSRGVLRSEGGELVELPAQAVYANSRVIPSGSSRIIRLGFAVAVPDGYGLVVLSRSGHGAKYHVRLANCVGLIDSDYRGEVMVALHNDGTDSFTIKHGDAIAQIALVPMPRIELNDVAELPPPGSSRVGGFGSTSHKEQLAAIRASMDADVVRLMAEFGAPEHAVRAALGDDWDVSGATDVLAYWKEEQQS